MTDRWEKRWRAAGNGRFTVPLSGDAQQRMKQLQADYGCTRRDLFEGLILGTIRPYSGPQGAPDRAAAVQQAMREHRLSRVEAEKFLSMGNTEGRQ